MLKNKIKNIPKSPGIYFFRDKKNKIIYIGKAKILRNRVSSYFNKLVNRDHKTKVMVKNIFDLDWFVTESETEALLAEANLIKEHKPRYNVFLKDDKTFPYIRITKELYPRVEIIRNKNLNKDNHTYFGPYTDTGHLRNILKIIHKIFPLRTCTFTIDEKLIKSETVKVCLDFHIKRCDGPCEGFVKPQKYGEMIQQIKRFLRGRNKEVKENLLKLMQCASKQQNYEDATRYRDQLFAIDSFIKKQKKTSQDFKDRDVLTISSENNYGIGFVIRIRNGHIIGREKFILKIYDSEKVKYNLSHFFVQYYTSTYDIPSEILIQESIDGLRDYEKWLSSVVDKRVKISIPSKGEKFKFIKMAKKNSDLLLNEIRLSKIKRKQYVNKAILQLKEDLNLEIPPIRIEAFDNSNIQGSNPVSGLVTYINGKPRKNEYRKFHIKTVKGIDDFATMHEVVSRRYKRQLDENKSLPDLILIDGGIGQLSAAKSALDALGLGYIAIIGLAKRLEEVYKPGINKPQNISKTSPGLHLLKNIRDEVHRYAISFHKAVRKKNMIDSVFSGITGLGPKRLKILWKEFETLDDIKLSSIINIKKKTGLPKSICRDIYNIVTKKGV